MAEFQCTTVQKPLASVARIVEKGNRVIFEEDGGYIENVKSGKKIKIIKNNGTFAIEVEFMVDEKDEVPTWQSNSGFTRQW